MLNRRMAMRALLGGALMTVGACGSGNDKKADSGPKNPQAFSPAVNAPNQGTGRWGMTPQQEAEWVKIEDAAKKEGSVTVYALTTIPPDQINRFLDMWKKDYPEIKVEMTTGRPADVTAKVTTEQQARAATGDVAEIGATTARQLNRLGYVVPFIPPATQDPKIKWRINPLVDDARTGAYLATRVGYVPFWINTNLVKPGEEPKTRADLTDPKWKGKIAWSTPWSAGYGWYEYYFGKREYGPDWVQKMTQQNVTFITDTQETLNQLSRGEHAIFVSEAGGDLASRLIEQNRPIKAIWPSDYTYGTPGGFVLLKGSPHQNAAKVFANWWFAEPGQKFLSELGQFTNRADIPPRYDWMKGFESPKQYFWFEKEADDAIPEPTQKEAASIFKK